MTIGHRKEILSQTRGRIEIAHLDGDALHIETREECQPLLDYAKHMQDVLADAPPKHYRLAAVVPSVVMDQAAREGWLHDKAAWKRWMNDIDNKRFRVWTGRM